MQVLLQHVAPATVLNTQNFKVRSLQIANIISLQNIRDLKYPEFLNLYKISGRKQAHRLVTPVTCFPQQLPNFLFHYVKICSC